MLNIIIKFPFKDFGGENYDCMVGAGTEYFGTARQTKRGVECKPWVEGGFSSKNHTHVGTHNHCRNPDGHATGVWCYTKNPYKEKDFCDVRQCTDQDASKLLGNI